MSAWPPPPPYRHPQNSGRGRQTRSSRRQAGVPPMNPRDYFVPSGAAPAQPAGGNFVGPNGGGQEGGYQIGGYVRPCDQSDMPVPRNPEGQIKGYVRATDQSDMPVSRNPLMQQQPVFRNPQGDSDVKVSREPEQWPPGQPPPPPPAAQPPEEQPPPPPPPLAPVIGNFVPASKEQEPLFGFGGTPGYVEAVPHPVGTSQNLNDRDGEIPGTINHPLPVTAKIENEKQNARPVAADFMPEIFSEDDPMPGPGDGGTGGQGQPMLAQPFSNSTSGNKHKRHWRDRKRKHEGLGHAGTENKKPKITGPKTASMILHEMCTTLVYNYSDMIGQPHDPTFTCTVLYTPNGKEYVGSGRSKKFAKQNVSEVILTDLRIPLPPRESASSSMSEDSNSNANDANANTSNSSSTPSLPLPGAGIAPSGTSPEMAEFLSLFRLPVAPPPPSANSSMDFSSDEIVTSSLFPPGSATLPKSFVSPAVLKRLRKIHNLEDNCTAAFNSMIAPATPTVEVLADEGPPHDKVYTIKLTVKDPNDIEKSFIGRGPSKKKAQADASKQALIELIGFDSYLAVAEYSNRPRAPKPQSQSKENSQLGDGDILMADVGNGNSTSEYNCLAFADHVANLVIEKYEELMTADEAHLPQKVLAGVVMTTGSPYQEHSTVIAVTTGTKCIEGDFMSEKGLALNDCHAEILATRCVRDFLYTELDKVLVDAEIPTMDLTADQDEPMKTAEEKNSIFELVQDHESWEGTLKFKLKENIKFHLYISTSPCGDARIFSPKGIDLTADIEGETLPPGDDSSSSEVTVEGMEIPDNHPNRINRGVLRAKIEAGEGTIPVANLSSGPQTWDGIMHGNALYTMSCSDKVCRWNAVGFQGALLAHFMDPIFYTSISLGSLHHKVHFKRAVITRVEKLDSILTHPYRLNKPELLMVSTKAKRVVKKSPNHAITWSARWSSHEVLSASKGCSAGAPSRLAKRIHFIRFLKIKSKSANNEQSPRLSYGEAKLQALDYQKAKSQFITLMKDLGYGNWITKPVEQDSFCID